MYNIGNIIEGHVNEVFKLNQDIAEKRLSICKVCPIYSERFGGTCNNKLWFNPKTNEISLDEKDNFVRGCGCRLKAKTTLADESCPADKW